MPRTRTGYITIWRGPVAGYREHPYVARELGENPIGYGNTPAEALGNLLLTDPRGTEAFGLKVTVDQRAVEDWMLEEVKE
jgi:hypothetical protein